MRDLGAWGIGLAALALVACNSPGQGHPPDSAVGMGGGAGAGTGGAGATGGAAADAGAVDASVSCSYLGEDHPVGDTWPSADKCNTCRCEVDPYDGTGDVFCSQMNCWADGGQLPCTFGVDQSCNEDPLQQQVLGVCGLNGTCICTEGYYPSSFTGRCLPLSDSSGNQCDYAGGRYPVGTDFQCAGSCDVCHCDAPGKISRKKTACDPAAAVLPCQPDTTYVYGTMGGAAPTSEVTVLNGPNLLYSHESTRYADGAMNGCIPRFFPACGTAGVVDLGDVLLDLLDPSIAAALGTRPAPVLFGLDTRSTGTPLTFVHRADGGELRVGGPCAGAVGCAEIPASVAHLVADLATLDQQALADINCSPWPLPGTFVCDNLLCTSGAEYCATASVNGAKTFAACRPYPNGCTTCACVQADFAPVTVPPGCSTNSFRCSEADGPVTTLSCNNG